MLYEIVAIARWGTANAKDAREVCRHVGKLIVNNRGVVRKIDNWGVRALPSIVHKDRQSHVVGQHFSLKFDSSAGVQREVMRVLRNDPRVIRSTLVRDGRDALKELNADELANSAR